MTGQYEFSSLSPFFASENPLKRRHVHANELLRPQDICLKQSSVGIWVGRLRRCGHSAKVLSFGK
jgi:hypothetical protein